MRDTLGGQRKKEERCGAQSPSSFGLHEVMVESAGVGWGGEGDQRQPESMFPGEDGCFPEPVVNILVVTREFLKDHLMACIYSVLSHLFVCALTFLRDFQIPTDVCTFFGVHPLTSKAPHPTPLYSQVHHLWEFRKQ